MREGRGRGGGPCALALVAVCVAGLPTSAPAQEGPPEERVDSTRLRVLDRLERLARPMGVVDTLELVGDTAQPGAQPGRAGAPGARTPAAAPRRAGADTVMDALLELPGYTPAEYEGQRAEFDARERRLTLYGAEDRRARIVRDGVELSADSAIVYDEATGRVRSMGDAVYTPERGDPVTSRLIVYDLDEARGSAVGARTRYSEGAQWFVEGDLPSVQPEIVYGSHTRFTSCDLEIPHYHFETDELKIVAGRILVARPVRLYFADVPVAWLPFMAQSLGTGRASGLLVPRFSVNDVVRSSSGYSRRISNVGFYWAMSEYTDASVALDWFSQRFTAVTGTFRYNWLRRFLRGDVNYRHYWEAEGGSQLAFDTRHNWEIDERTRFNAEARYSSSSDFVRQNSYDPREVTQTISSSGGVNRRFDWGSVNVGANRQQYLSDDRVEATLPNVGLSLSPITLLRAAPGQERFFSNITWTGGGSYNRQTSRFAALPDTVPFLFSAADRTATTASMSSGFNLGNLSWSQNVSFREDVRHEVPDTLFPGAGGEEDGGAESPPDLRDLAQATLTWSSSLNYQQRLIGSTSLTPSLTLSGDALRSDTIPEAAALVYGPRRLSLGAALKTDLYGFFPGFGPFTMVRHKISPEFSYSYTPEVQPTELQQRVFGDRAILPRKQLTVRLTQTFEAKPREDRRPDEAGADAPAAVGEPDADPDRFGLEVEAGDTLDLPPVQEPQPMGAADGGARRLETVRPVMLLSVSTSMMTYDFVRADSLGDWKQGLSPSQLSNQISSDYLRGLSISVTHDLFDDVRPEGEGPVRRRLAPHLTGVNTSFSLSSESAIFRLLGLARRREPREERAVPPDTALDEEEDEDLLAPRGVDETSIVPGARGAPSPQERARRRQPTGTWRASFNYSLQRPRLETAPTRQMLASTVTFRPTESWDVSWRTSYDVEDRRFNDHILRLTRDIHDWEAHFDFLQTATGNWSFRFEVSLKANRDLKFDYEQRSLDPRTLRR